MQNPIKYHILKYISNEKDYELGARRHHDLRRQCIHVVQ